VRNLSIHSGAKADRNTTAPSRLKFSIIFWSISKIQLPYLSIITLRK
jgi:hypothetical protein